MAALGTLSVSLRAWTQGTQLPAVAPTAGAASPVAPITATPLSSSPQDTTTAKAGRPEVSCTGGLLTVRAQNSSLNGILRAISRCTGMRISGGVAEQRVFGEYGPAAPATVLATLIDGTGSNMLLRETSADQPAELILTPRTGAATPPSPASYSEEEADTPTPAGNALAPSAQSPYGMRGGMSPAQRSGSMVPPQTASPQPSNGSAVTSPPSIPQPANNVTGSPDNVTPTASTYPTTNSVPVDSIPTPSTTPSPSGIVDTPNPPAAGSDTAAAAAAANGNGNSGNPSGQNNGQAPTDLTPEQIFQQLQQRQQQQNQQQTPQNPSANPN